MRYVCKNPPGGERNPYQLIDYKVDNRQTNKQTDKQTGQKQYAPDHSIPGHKHH